MLLRRHRRYLQGVAENVTPVFVDIKQDKKVQVPVDNSEKVQEQSAEPYTKTIISRMNLEALKKLAEEKGLEIAEEETGTSLKKRLIGLLVK